MLTLIAGLLVGGFADLVGSPALVTIITVFGIWFFIPTAVLVAAVKER